MSLLLSLLLLLLIFFFFNFFFSLLSSSSSPSSFPSWSPSHRLRVFENGFGCFAVQLQSREGDAEWWRASLCLTMVPRRRPPQAGVGQGLGLSTGLALLLTLSALLTPSTGSASTRWARFHRLPDLENHVINPSVDSLVGQHSHVTSPAQCAAACLTTTACSSFFLLHDVAQCLLHAIVFLGKDEATARPDTSYWRISHGQSIGYCGCQSVS